MVQRYHVNLQYSNWGRYNELLKRNCFSGDSFVELNKRLFHLRGICVSLNRIKEAFRCCIDYYHMWNSHGRPTEQFHMFWLVPLCPGVFSWEPQCWEALTPAGHCWVLVQCRKQVLNSQQQSMGEHCLQAEAQVWEAWDFGSKSFPLSQQVQYNKEDLSHSSGLVRVLWSLHTRKKKCYSRWIKN